jgi:hypothetical protein
MSWSISVVGKAGAVATKVTEQLTRIKCSEPEETIKNSVGSILITALAAYPGNSAVSVSASGSQGSAYDSEGKPVPGSHVNSLSVALTPLYGFVD